MKPENVIFLERIEEYLLKSNIHTDVVKKLMNYLGRKVISNENLTKEEIVKVLRNQIKYIIGKYAKTFDIENCQKPYVMLVCGVNGSGKTTMIGKMVNLLKAFDWDVLVASCDTFRAAANEQLQKWITDLKNDFLMKEKETDTPARIATRAYKIAKEKKKDVLIIDTSGRLQNNQDLMAELLKMKQKLKSISINIPNDVVLIIDSNSGYNALEQAKMYNDLISITGIMATKIDIAKRPGMILSICSLFEINVFGISDGEDKDKIRDIDPDEFADAILCDIKEIF